MNIMLFSKIIARSGVGNHIRMLSLELARQGHNVVVVSATNDLNIGSNAGGGVEFVKINRLSLSPITIIKSIRMIRKIIKKKKIDIVHCHHRMAGLYMKFYRFFHKIPVVYTLHLADIPSDFIHRLMTDTGDMAIGVSSEVSRFMIEKLGIQKEKVVTIYNGVDCDELGELSQEEKERLRRKWEIPEDKIILALHSRIEEVKNHMLVVKTAAELSDKTKEKLLFLCSGSREGSYYKKMKTAIKNYGLEDEFRFVGWSKTREILGTADLLILPSTKEGFPLSVVEAFLMKRPVVSTRTAGFDDQSFCIPIRHDNTIDLKNILNQIAEDGIDKVYENVEEAYQYAKENFTVEAMTRKTVLLYETVAGKKRGIK